MLVIRPPEYFPRLAFAALMLRAGTVVLADTFQYSRQSYQNRTRLRNPQGWQWISVPLKARQHGTPIEAVRIRQSVGWRRQHWKALAFNYRSTPYFEYYESDLAALFETDWTHLGALTCATVELIHRLLRASSRLLCASQLDGAPADLPSIYKVRDDKPLLAPEEAAPYDAPQVPDLRVLHVEHPTYRQAFEGFEPGMSTLDLLFNYGPEARAIIERSIVVSEYAEPRLVDGDR